MRKNRGTAYGVIGLGRFGTALAIALAQAGKEVIAIDRSEEKIKNIRRYTDYAFVAENLSMETLKEIGIQNCDVAIICIGEKVDVSILEPKTITRSEGKAVRVVDKRDLYNK